MKSISLLAVMFTGILMLSSGCDDDTGISTDPVITLLNPTQITETSFVAHWSVDKTGFKTVEVEVSVQNDFSSDVIIFTVPSVTQTSMTIEGLTGATSYYHRVKGYLDDVNNTSIYSTTKSVATTYNAESVELTTSDGLHLEADLYYLGSNTGKHPGIIFLHQYDRITNMWKNANLTRDLIAQRYICFTFDFRSHGESDDWPRPQNCAELEEFIGHCKKDVLSAIDFMKNHALVDPTRIVLVGASMGANLSLICNGEEGIAASVALTPSRIGINTGHTIRNAFFIAGSLDIISACEGPVIDFEEEATILYNGSEEPKKLLIVDGANDHGWELLDKGGVEQEIRDWIDARTNK